MKLSTYLADTKTSDEDFGARIGCDRTTVLRLRRGDTRPSHAVMEKIIAATAGKVQPNDFFDIPETDAA